MLQCSFPAVDGAGPSLPSPARGEEREGLASTCPLLTIRASHPLRHGHGVCAEVSRGTRMMRQNLPSWRKACRASLPASGLNALNSWGLQSAPCWPACCRQTIGSYRFQRVGGVEYSVGSQCLARGFVRAAAANVNDHAKQRLGTIRGPARRHRSLASYRECIRPPPTSHPIDAGVRRQIRGSAKIAAGRPAAARPPRATPAATAAARDRRERSERNARREFTDCDERRSASLTNASAKPQPNDKRFEHTPRPRRTSRATLSPSRLLPLEMAPPRRSSRTSRRRLRAF